MQTKESIYSINDSKIVARIRYQVSGQARVDMTHFLPYTSSPLAQLKEVIVIGTYIINMNEYTIRV